MNFKDQLKLQRLNNTTKRVKTQCKVLSCDLYIRLDSRGQCVWEGVYFKPEVGVTRCLQIPVDNQITYSYIEKQKKPRTKRGFYFIKE